MGCGSSNDGKEPTRRKSQQTKSLKDVKISPDIFVSLKLGSLSTYYQIGEVLGEGGFGCVRIATHKETSEFDIIKTFLEITRAIKQLRKDKLFKEDEQLLFAEVDLLKELDHPNILKIHELYQDAKNYYIISEYLEGGELFDRLQSQKVYTEKMAADVMKQVLSAVSYCHQREIVHRDLKLENLIYESKNKNSNLKVIDFGTSRKFNPNEKLTRRIGTPYYMAPEVLQKSYNEKCDVWSCGVILYILLCGYPPFNGDDYEIKRRIQEGKFEYDPEEWGSISQDAKDLINKMLTYDPEERISSQEALNDPWIQTKAPDGQINTKQLKNLQNFYLQSNSKWKTAIQLFIVTQVQSNTEKEQILKQFKAMDANNDGTLNKEELIQAYEKVYDKTKAQEVTEQIFESVDVNQSGLIDYTGMHFY